MSKPTDFAKAMSAASSGPIRRRIDQTPAGNPSIKWSHWAAGSLNRDACEGMREDGLLAEDSADPGAYHLTDAGSARLARMRSEERAWLA